MDPERIHAYLQAACSGLGFDIGEVWFSSRADNGTETVSSLGRGPPQSQSTSSTLSTLNNTTSSNGHSSSFQVNDNNDDGNRNIRFLQLYTSKSFNSRRNDLLKPDIDNDDNNEHQNQYKNEITKKPGNSNKHVLSPMLVNAIAKNAQVVWANCQKQEGLLGRSDMRLQTAVGMPVAMDSAGNMCIVVMFSPKNVTSSKEAIDFIKLISQGASATARIPSSLLPVIDSDRYHTLAYSPKKFCDWEHERLTSRTNSTGIITTTNDVLSNDHGSNDSRRNDNDVVNELSFLPKDQYGIPILPEFAELNTDTSTHNQNDEDDEEGDYVDVHDLRRVGASSPLSDDLAVANEFDNATYGLWSTIMNSPKINDHGLNNNNDINVTTFPIPSSTYNTHNNISSSPLQLLSQNQLDCIIQPERKERLEEFVSAFLGLSAFDLADVWVPVTAEVDGSVCTLLHNVFCMSSSSSDAAIFDDHYSNYTGRSSNNESIDGGGISSPIAYFKHVSKNTIIKGWAGAVGRAQCSGNPVWSTNPDIIIDEGRRDAFIAANIQTALAVPINSNGTIPTCVLSCYSMVRSDSETFVLKFLQQALRSLWAGLDNVEPHESIGKTLWKGVAPADLGEMAADTEMQKAFYKKKRPFDMITSNNEVNNVSNCDSIYNSSPSDDTMQSKVKRKNEDEMTTLIHRQRSSSLAMQFQALSKQEERRQQQRQQPQQFNQTKSNSQVSSFLYTPVDQSSSQTRSDTVYSNTATSNQRLYVQQSQTPFATNTVSNQSSTYYNVQQSQTPLPTLEDIKDDRDAAKNFIDAINALVQNNNNSMNGFQSSYHVTNNNNNYNNPGLVSNNNININANNAYVTLPESSVSSGGGMIFCAPVPTTMYHNTSSTTIDNNNNVTTFTGTDTVPIITTTSAIRNSMKLCRIEGCNTEAISKRPYCSRHSGNRLCEYEGGCTKCAQGATRFCIAHGGGRRCTFPGCDKGARDKFYCAAHGGGKRCSRDGCNKSAVGGSSLCTSHGGGRRCSVNGCEKSAQSSTKFCVKHGGGKKCAYQSCDKVARGRTLYCAGHGGGVRCKLEGCSRIAIGKMQLCRAHGGGSSRSKAKSGSQTVSPDPTSPSISPSPTQNFNPSFPHLPPVFLNEAQGHGAHL